MKATKPIIATVEHEVLPVLSAGATGTSRASARLPTLYYYYCRTLVQKSSCFTDQCQCDDSGHSQARCTYVHTPHRNICKGCKGGVLQGTPNRARLHMCPTKRLLREVCASSPTKPQLL